MKIKKGDFVIIDVESLEDTGGPNADPSKGDSGSPSELEKAPENVKKVELGAESGSGASYERSGTVKPNTLGKIYQSQSTLGQGGSKQKATVKWENALRNALSRASGSLSEKAKRLLTALRSVKPKVNWKKELRKSLDQTFSKYEEVLPNRRFLSRGDILWGEKEAGKDTLRTLVLPVDTSGSISKEQIGTFLNEVFSLTKMFEIDVVYIVYTSDSIDSIDVVTKGKKPDLGMIRSTGGNREGFFPPFRFIQDPKKYQGKANGVLPKKIDPSAVIYFTDTFAEYPTRNDFGIAKYVDRVIWFICLRSSEKFNKPPFGRYIHVPIDSKGNFA